MSSNLSGQTVVVVGGSSGMGYSAAKASLLERAAHVVIASSSKAKVEAAVQRLKADTANASVDGIITGEVLDAKHCDSVKAFFEKVGEIDHLLWTSGDWLDQANLEACKEGAFEVRFWGAAIAAKAAKIREGGSIIFTTGSVLLRPQQGYTIGAAVSGATDAYTRALAMDMAPIRVNSVCPGAVKTELWHVLPNEVQSQLFDKLSSTLLLKHVALPDEIAEAYVFLMKCKYITGQRIVLDSGALNV